MSTFPPDAFESPRCVKVGGLRRCNPSLDVNLRCCRDCVSWVFCRLYRVPFPILTCVLLHVIFSQKNIYKLEVSSSEPKHCEC